MTAQSLRNVSATWKYGRHIEFASRICRLSTCVIYTTFLAIYINVTPVTTTATAAQNSIENPAISDIFRSIDTDASATDTQALDTSSAFAKMLTHTKDKNYKAGRVRTLACHAQNQRKGNDNISKKHPIVTRARTRSVKRILSSFEGILFLNFCFGALSCAFLILFLSSESLVSSSV